MGRRITGGAVILALLIFLPCGAAASSAGAEIVVVVDNSGSMKGADPERLAVLGGAIIDGLGANPADEVTVIGFGSSARSAPPTTRTTPDIRTWPTSGGTYFRKPLEEALRIFERSSKPNKMLIFFTDGTPGDVSSPAQLRTVFDPAAHPDIDVLAVGLFGLGASEGERMLRAIVHDPRDMRSVDSAGEIVTAFTEGYARAMGSEAETGTLSPGQEHRIGVGRYVSEITVIVASKKPGDPFTARLAGPAGDVPLLSEGDNGCRGASRCSPPYRHYQLFRATNDDHRPGEWILTLPSAPGDVEYGVIMRYGMRAEAFVPPAATAGTPTVIEGQLTIDGQPVDDEAFFGENGFTAVVEVGGESVPLEHVGGGRFRAEWTPDRSAEGDEFEARLVFRNDFMERDAVGTMRIEAVQVDVATALPDRCEEGEPCVVDVTVGPAAGATDPAATTALIADPATRVVLGDTGAPATVERVDDTHFRIRVTPTAEGRLSLPIHVELPGGERITAAPATLEVIAPLVLVTPEVLDFGTLRAGSATTAEDHCLALDLAGSKRLERHEFRIELIDVGRSCRSTPVRVVGEGTAPETTPIATPRTKLSVNERLCLQVPPCAGEKAPAEAALRITPLDPASVGQTAEIPLAWTVERRSWIVCNLWWILAVLAALFLAWVVYGFIRPARFPPHAAVCTAGNVSGLKRAAAVTLVEVRGSGAGFYRDARLGLFVSGDLRGRVRGAACRIRASRTRGTVLEGGSVECRNRRTRRWEPPEDLATGHVPQEGAYYRSGSLYFRFEGV